jgi:excisionase family DNA binding protein
VDVHEKPGTVEPALLSPEQLAAYLGCGRTFAFKLIAESRIPSIKLGRLRRVRRQDADAFVERLAEAERAEDVKRDADDAGEGEGRGFGPVGR